MIKKPIISFFTSVIVIFLTISAICAQEAEETVAYKLAFMHARDIHPDGMLASAEIIPDRATVSEFQWILETLRIRCINSEKDIATIIVGAWRLVKNRGYEKTLLEIARALTTHTNSPIKFGSRKVNFRMAAGLWTKTYMPEKK